MSGGFGGFFPALFRRNYFFSFFIEGRSKKIVKLPRLAHIRDIREYFYSLKKCFNAPAQAFITILRKIFYFLGNMRRNPLKNFLFLKLLHMLLIKPPQAVCVKLRLPLLNAFQSKHTHKLFRGKNLIPLLCGRPTEQRHEVRNCVGKVACFSVIAKSNPLRKVSF